MTVSATPEPVIDRAGGLVRLRAREDRADHLLLLGREELDHARDSLGCVDRVQRRKHEVAGLRSLQRSLCSLRIAELADGALQRADVLFGWRPLAWCPEIF